MTEMTEDTWCCDTCRQLAVQYGDMHPEEFDPGDEDYCPDCGGPHRPSQMTDDWLSARGALADVWDGTPAEVTIRKIRG